MSERGWRTIIVDSASELYSSDGNLMLKTEKQLYEFPIIQICTVFIASTRVNITTALINELNKQNIRMVFCDEKYNPVCEIEGYSNHTDSSGRLMDQIEYSSDIKALIWKRIVENKVDTQCKLLDFLKIDYPDRLKEYLNEVELDDVSNREGQAARIYFNCLFGMDFIRHSFDNTNSALNYGYTILLSLVNRVLSLHGYNSSLGIKHCSRSNPFNLSCDLMEPFRPFIDWIVFKNKDRELDWEYKKELIAINYMPVLYDNKKTELCIAVENYVLTVLKALKNKESFERNLDFVR